ncbi:hypothetical protein ABZ532_17740 [Streptomyces sp. NPDC019396]|uniref:hypothetical protein n=1 Tax=Streptomyces sp. NPDC019396 TaxID=3154687 RepID=UPI0033D8A83A
MSESQVADVLSRRWKVTVLAAAGFATVVATTTIVTIRDSEEPGPQAATALVDDKGDEGGGGHGEAGDRGGHDEYAHDTGVGTTHVECDPNDLIATLVELNGNSGGELDLAKDCTYTLTANEDGNGLPRITQPVVIHGNGATIQRAANADDFRFFEVESGGDLRLRHLTLTRGKAAVDEDGGALYVHAGGRLDLDRVTVTRNTMFDPRDNSQDGAGVYNEGVTTIRNSTFGGNTSDDGAAVFNLNGKVEIHKSKIIGNVSDPGDGRGVVYNEGGSLRISKSLVGHNHAFQGGAVYSEGGTTQIEGSGVVYNRGAIGGGAHHVDGTLAVRGSTFAHNTATTGAGGGGFSLEGSAVIEDSRIHGNVAVSGNGGGVITNTGEAGQLISIRDSKIYDNQAPGNGAVGGGIFVGEGDEVRLTDTKVTGNISDEPAGGVHNLGTVTTHGKVRIVDNVPTNCQATGTNPVPNCFG